MQASELILNPDQSIYHLSIHPDQVGDTIITVGDPDRVAMVSKHFDKIIVRQQSREFVTHSGYIKNKRITVISTGIGTDNIDIVINELDALVNFDLKTRKPKKQHKTLNIIRIGTSGAIHSDIPVDSFIESSFAIGLDALQQYYTYDMKTEEAALHQEINNKLKAKNIVLHPTVAKASYHLKLEGIEIQKGITVTSPGFYAPQGRHIRLKPKYPNLITELGSISFNQIKCTNLEMETAGIYTLSNLLGHRAISLNAILANRITGDFSANPQETVHRLIEAVVRHLRSD